MASYNQCQSDKGHCVMLGGTGGSGTSSRVQDFASSQDERLLFCTGKFDTHRAGEPYSAVVGAFYSLYCEPFAATLEEQQELSAALDYISLDETILREILPKVYRAANGNDTAKAIESTNSSYMDRSKTEHAEHANASDNELRNGSYIESSTSRLHHAALFNLLRSNMSV